jgi:hypothetical protein
VATIRSARSVSGGKTDLDPDAEMILTQKCSAETTALTLHVSGSCNARWETSLFLIYGLVGAAGGGLESRYRVGSLESGTLLCQAYEAYLELHSPASISFEHAWFLLLALARRDEVGVARCNDCGGLLLRDLLARRNQFCGNCQQGWPGPSH